MSGEDRGRGSSIMQLAPIGRDGVRGKIAQHAGCSNVGRYVVHREGAMRMLRAASWF